ncbi:hypothetical protein LMH87_001396 [Akanthomyces muscarius]|uniref:FAD/NAD(P)-binding domain-containing protein n=1 Tax=Akanthomyces muscarius TaxID=2231603 RepID=A0A9W8Q479_AKAMU|nr:hypothetical protein LMH87_001396 [Akanthomyces muscarius]KAJ4146837.1 hypothetical protein LMH87_001396 [Akanthomyces muscarius]
MKTSRAALRTSWSSSPSRVIIGASFAGHYAARLLARSLPADSKYRVVVIEPNSHFQFTWVLPRFCVIPGGHEHKAFVPYGKYADAADGALHWIKDRAVRITESAVVLQDADESVPYEYLVIATGAAVQDGLPSRVNNTENAEGLKRLEVEVILEDRVIEEDDTNGTVTLKSGRKIERNYFINCTGQKPNSSILATLAPASTSTLGYIKVKPTLQ